MFHASSNYHTQLKLSKNFLDQHVRSASKQWVGNINFTAGTPTFPIPLNYLTTSISNQHRNASQRVMNSPELILRYRPEKAASSAPAKVSPPAPLQPPPQGRQGGLCIKLQV